MPYILVIYDAGADVAYRVYIQAYFEKLAGFTLTQATATVTVHLQKANTLDQLTMRAFAQCRDEVLKQLQGVIRHNA